MTTEEFEKPKRYNVKDINTRTVYNTVGYVPVVPMDIEAYDPPIKVREVSTGRTGLLTYMGGIMDPEVNPDWTRCCIVILDGKREVRSEDDFRVVR